MVLKSEYGLGVLQVLGERFVKRRLLVSERGRSRFRIRCTLDRLSRNRFPALKLLLAKPGRGDGDKFAGLFRGFRIRRVRR